MATERNGTAFGPDEIFGELTPREQDVATLINQGFTNDEIANQLTLGQSLITWLICWPRQARGLAYAWQ